MDTNFVGLEETQAWLRDQGYTIGLNWMNNYNASCNWHAYKTSNIPARECECNEGKGGMQVVVEPHLSHNHTSYEVEVTGEAGGIWYQIMAYSINEDELKTRLPEIEVNLIAAWNAIGGAKNGEM